MVAQGSASNSQPASAPTTVITSTGTPSQGVPANSGSGSVLPDESAGESFSTPSSTASNEFSGATEITSKPSTESQTTTTNASTESAANQMNTKTTPSSVNQTADVASQSTTNSSSTLASSASSDNNGSVPTGALAGGVVGAFIAGALLALIAAFLFGMRPRRRKSTERGSGDVSFARHRDQGFEKTPELKITTATWERHLPQSVDDQGMKATVQSLLNQVILHVDNFYARTNVELTSSLLDSLVRMDTSLLPGPLPDMMAEPDLQLLAIKHCITCLITSRMLPSGGTDMSLLPPHLADLPEKLGPSYENDKELPAARQAYAQWKVLTSYLYSNSDTTAPSSIRQQRKATMDIINIVSAAFARWEMRPSEGPSATEHLARIIETARETGASIMSQASSFEFQWHSTSRQEESQGHMIVMPGFVKTADEKGRPLERSQILVRPFVQRLREGN